MSAATLIKVRPSRAKVREQFPLTVTEARWRMELTPSQFARYRRYFPPDYQSKGGRVQRYRAPMKPEPYGIYGFNAHDLHVQPVCYQNAEPRAVGSFQDMHAIVKRAVREWPALTFRREIEEVAARYFVAVVIPEPVAPPPPEFNQPQPAH